MKKLFLYSMHTPQTDFNQLDLLTGKKPRGKTISVITNAPEIIKGGLHLIEQVVVPHFDNPDFRQVLVKPIRCYKMMVSKQFH